MKGHEERFASFGANVYSNILFNCTVLTFDPSLPQDEIAFVKEL